MAPLAPRRWGPRRSRPEAPPPFLATPCPDPRPRHPSHHSTSVPHLAPAPHPRPAHLPHSLNLSLLDPPSAPPTPYLCLLISAPAPQTPLPPRGRRALQALGAAAEEAVAAGAPHELPAAGRQRGPGSRAQQQVRGAGGGEGAGPDGPADPREQTPAGRLRLLRTGGGGGGRWLRRARWGWGSRG